MVRVTPLVERISKLESLLKKAEESLALAQGLLAQQVLYQPTVASPVRTLNAVFRPNLTRPVLGFYVVSLAAVSTLVGGQNATVRLLSDTAVTPTTERARGHLSLTQALGVNANLQSQQVVSLSYLIPAGHRVQLVSTGTGALSLIGSTEITF